MPVFITDLNIEEVNKLVATLGAPAYRAKQLLGWVYRKLAVSYDEMTDLPLSLRQKLAAVYGPEAAPACDELWGDVRLAHLGLPCSIQGGHPKCPYATPTHVAGAVAQSNPPLPGWHRTLKGGQAWAHTRTNSNRQRTGGLTVGPGLAD